jgi:hypothetical protein
MILHILLVDVTTVIVIVKFLYHPAQPINPTCVFNMCGMDLIFGLPPTTEGHTGIVVITEYVTKFPYAAPKKIKT